MPPAINSARELLVAREIADRRLGAAKYAKGTSGLPLLRHRLLNRRDDIDVRAAAADIPAHVLANLIIGGREAFGHESHGRDDLPGRAITTLKSIVLDERRLQRMQVVAVGQPFDRRNCFALVHHRQRETRVDPFAINENGTRAALSKRTAFLCPGEMKPFTQRVDQCRSRVDLHTSARAIDLERQRWRQRGQ